MKKTLYLCMLLIVASATSQAQQMYRWTDSKGVVHYTEYAPDETREQILNFDPENPPEDTTKNVKKINKMQTTQALLVEIEEKKSFDPNEPVAKPKTRTKEVAALDPKEMTYCQIIHTNIATFNAFERGDIDQIINVKASGEHTPVATADIEQQYKSTIDNLEKYCLQ